MLENKYESCLFSFAVCATSTQQLELNYKCRASALTYFRAAEEPAYWTKAGSHKALKKTILGFGSPGQETEGA